MGIIIMTDNIKDEVFQLIDSMYNNVKAGSNDPDILGVLMKAATALNKGMAPQVVAAKTVNGINLFVLGNKKMDLDDNFNSDYTQLIKLSRAGSYKWIANGVGDLRIQFF